MNPNNELDRGRLFRAMSYSYRQLEPFRNMMHGLVEEYVGSGYGPVKTKPRHEMLLNLTNQAVDAYTMCLVANRPRVLVTTHNPNLKFFARVYQEAVNNLNVEIELEAVFRQAVLDAIFGVGILKIHMADSVQVELEEGLWMDPGLPAASNVSLDDWVYDTSAKRYDKVKFAADCYRIPFADLESDIFDRRVVRQLRPTSKTSYDGNDARLENISKGEETDQDEVEPMIDLMDVWVPRAKKIFTFAMDNTRRFDGKFAPVADMPWDGPEFGPYRILSFNDVPENIMPTSPASHLAGLQRLVNNILRKQSKRARSQKRVHTYTPAEAEGAKNIQRADDDEWKMVTDPSQIGTVDIGGPDATMQAFAVGLVQLFDRMAGNLTAMLGLGAQSETVGQEQLIHSANSRKEAQMQYRVVDFAVRTIRDLGYLLWNDRVKTIPGTIPIEGVDGYTLDVTWHPDHREGDYWDYDLGIDIYSMSYQSPAQRVQSLITLITRVYAPLAPMMQQQGQMIDIAKMSEIFAELLNQPHLRELIRAVAPVDAAPQQESRMPSASSREYLRRSVSTQGSPQGQQVQEQQRWLSLAGSQEGEQ